jgi:hypothetical protein
MYNFASKTNIYTFLNLYMKQIGLKPGRVKNIS